jgi:ribosomal protein S18 acetylase RimI-like enzyme
VASLYFIAKSMHDEKTLDNVIWESLNGRHAALAMGSAAAKRFPASVAPFGALRSPASGTAADLAGLLHGAATVAIVTPGSLHPLQMVVPVMKATLDQMVLRDPGALESVRAVEADVLGLDDVPAMLALTGSTKPGPFERRTIELGRYLGIKPAGQLAAMGGERLKVAGFTEISAVCVAPEFRGRGYAAALIKSLATLVLDRGETPFLHVVTGNSSAVALYERLGFRHRARFNLNVFDAAHLAGVHG